MNIKDHQSTFIYILLIARTNGTTPFIIACSHGHLSIVELLLTKHNININHARENDKCTALFAASRHGHVECVTKILQHPDIDVNAAESNGRTPLFIASFFGNAHLVRTLLESGNNHNIVTDNKKIVDIDQADVKGFTPLFVASQNGHLDVVHELLKYNVCCILL